MSIQSDKVISDISEAMSKSIRKLFPEDIGHEEEKPGMVVCEVLCVEKCGDDINERIQDDFIIGKVRTPLRMLSFQFIRWWK